jgi:hypothetical protein
MHCVTLVSYKQAAAIANKAFVCTAGFANGAASGRAAGRKRGLTQTLQLQSEQALSNALANSPTVIPAPPGAQHLLPQDDKHVGVDGSLLTSADYASRDTAKESENGATTVSAYGAARDAPNVQSSPADDKVSPQADVPRVNEHLGSPGRISHAGDSSIGHDPSRQH